MTPDHPIPDPSSPECQINHLEYDHVDPAICPILASIGASGVDVPGAVEVNDQGDVFVLGEPFWDCPPYDLFPPAG